MIDEDGSDQLNIFPSRQDSIHVRLVGLPSHLHVGFPGRNPCTTKFVDL
jgi:hypothetical protein